MSTTAIAPRREDAPSARTGSHQYLSFRVGDELYAAPILTVKEILEYGAIAAVPMMPAWVRGVINLRGRVVPVVDAGLLFGKGASTPGRRSCFVIVEVGEDAQRQELGIIVDAVNQVVDIPAADIEPPPSLGATVPADFVAGMGKLDGQFVILLDVDRILAVDQRLAAGALLA